MKPPAHIFKVIKVTAGRFHCWVNSSTGKIKKENRNVPDHIWDEFEKRDLKIEIELKWYQKLLFWFKKLWTYLKKNSKKKKK